jgi:hypothetical protein
MNRLLHEVPHLEVLRITPLITLYLLRIVQVVWAVDLYD